MQGMLPFVPFCCIDTGGFVFSLLRRDRTYLPVGRQALDDFAYSIPEQRLHAALNSCVEHVSGSGP